MEQERSFGEWLEERIERRGWNKSEFAREAGVGRARVSDWVKGKFIPDSKNAADIARALGIPTVLVMVKAGRIQDEDRIDPNSDRANLMGMLQVVDLSDRTRVRVLESILIDMLDEDAASPDPALT